MANILIVSSQVDQEDNDFVWARVATLDTDLDWYSKVIHVETGDIEAYIAANEEAIAADILATGTLDETLNELYRLDNMHLRWLDGDTLISGLAGSTSGASFAPDDLVSDGLRIDMPAGTDGKTLRARQNSITVLTIDSDGQLSATTIQAIDGNGLKFQDDAGNYGVFIQDNTGYVGIGHASPATGLHLKGSGLGREIRIESTDDDPGFRFVRSNGDRWLFQFVGSDDNRARFLSPTGSEFVMMPNGNFGFRTNTAFGSGAGVIGIQNATTAPSTNPSGGGVLYAQAGALKWRGSGGTTTTIAPAEPHCPVCGQDYMQEWDNAEYGYLAVCMNCFAEEMGEKPWIIRGESRL